MTKKQRLKEVEYYQSIGREYGFGSWLKAVIKHHFDEIARKKIKVLSPKDRSIEQEKFLKEKEMEQKEALKWKKLN